MRSLKLQLQTVDLFVGERRPIALQFPLQPQARLIAVRIGQTGRSTAATSRSGSTAAAATASGTVERGHRSGIGVVALDGGGIETAFVVRTGRGQQLMLSLLLPLVLLLLMMK